VLPTLDESVGRPSHTFTGPEVAISNGFCSIAAPPAQLPKLDVTGSIPVARSRSDSLVESDNIGLNGAAFS
jgi:hypothetical protein